MKTWERFIVRAHTDALNYIIDYKKQDAGKMYT